ncbi:MAG: hypothetical protein EP332_06190 [Bacteroidetes bacterium]|nr:MAG: hypothetical protein EP332_06190 [Bacteroidota bacterium]
MNTPKHTHGRDQGRWFGLFFIILGIAWMMKKLGIEVEPKWLLTWPSALILLGFFIAIKQKFRGAAGFIIMLIGGFFLARNEFGLPHNLGMLIWPSILIIAGLSILFKPRKKKDHFCSSSVEEENIDRSKLDVSSVFCGSKKRVLSKEFEGGHISAVFGGAELNLSHADFEKEAVLDVSILFGGLKIIVPANWEVKTQLNTVAAGIEDKRYIPPMEHSPEKTLILSGSITFGGIEIVSH